MAAGMFDFQVRMTGVQAAVDKLRGLSPALQKKALKTAVRRGGYVVKTQAVRNMKQYDDPRSPRKIWKNIVVQYRPRSSKSYDGVVMAVGVLGGAKQYVNNPFNRRTRRVGLKYLVGGDKGNPGGDTWYWRFVEYGIPSRGIAAKRPMLRALQTMSQPATNAIADTLHREIPKVAATATRYFDIRSTP